MKRLALLVAALALTACGSSSGPATSDGTGGSTGCMNGVLADGGCNLGVGGGYTPSTLPTCSPEVQAPTKGPCGSAEVFGVEETDAYGNPCYNTCANLPDGTVACAIRLTPGASVAGTMYDRICQPYCGGSYCVR